MTVNTTAISAKVLAACVKVGRTVTLTDYVDTYSTATGKTTRVATDYTVQASPPYQKRRGFSNDSQPSGGAAILFPASGITVTPKAGQKVATGGLVYTIVDVTTHELVSTVLAYECTLTQGGPT